MNNLRGFDASEFLIQAAMFESEFIVIDTKGMKDCGVEVSDVHWVLGYVVAPIIGSTILKALFDAAAGHPD